LPGIDKPRKQEADMRYCARWLVAAGAATWLAGVVFVAVETLC
jgi:hypothetical protein